MYLAKKIYLLILFSIVLNSSILANEYELYNRTEIQTPNLPECSGLAISSLNENIFWGVNDSNGRPSIYAVNMQTGKLIAEIYLKNISNLDFEELALIENPFLKGEYLIYIFDTGDNYKLRNSSFIYIVKEPKLDLTLEEQYIALKSSEYENYNISYSNGKHNVEAAFINPKNCDIYLIAKETEKAEVFIITYPYNKNNINTAKYISELMMGANDGNSITAADISPKGDKIIIKSIKNVFLYDNSNSNSNITETLITNPKIIKAYQKEPQGEAIAFASNNSDFYTISEVVGNSKQFLSHYKLKSNYVKQSNFENNIKIHINNDNINIAIKSKIIEPYTIAIYDFNGKKISQFSEGYLSKGKNRLSFPLPELNSKIIIIHININGNVYIHKLIM